MGIFGDKLIKWLGATVFKKCIPRGKLPKYTYTLMHLQNKPGKKIPAKIGTR